MVLFLVLLIALVILAFIAGVALCVGGVGFIVVVADLVVCACIIAAIIRGLIKKNLKKVNKSKES